MRTTMFNLFKDNKKEIGTTKPKNEETEKEVTLSYDELKKEYEALKGLIECSFTLNMNLNDTFHYASADSEDIDSEDFLDLIPLATKYSPFKAMTAYCSVKREKLFNEKNLSPIAYYKYPEDMELFKEAQIEIEKDIKGDEKFADLSFELDQLNKELKEFGEKIIWRNSKLPSGLLLQVATLEKQKIYGVGSCRRDAEDDLRKKLKEIKND